jgi:hypothetical protein
MRVEVVVPMQIFHLPLGSLHAGRCECKPGSQIRRRRDLFVEDPDLRRIPDAEDVTVDVDGVLEFQVADDFR